MMAACLTLEVVPMFAAGIVVLVLTLILAIVHVVQRRKIGHLLTARKTTVGELAATAKAVAGELGGGGFEEMAALSGTVQCDAPVVAPLSGRPCLHYRMAVRRRYEEDVERRDQNGNVHRETRRGSDTMSTQQEGVHAFRLVDGTGAIEVLAEGLDHDARVETVDRFEPQHGGHGGLSIGYGRFSMTVDHGGFGNRRTLGYEYEEHIVPLDGRFTVLGRVSDRSGVLAVEKGGAVFSMSRKDRDEQIGGAKGTAQWTGIASGVGLIVGVILTAVGALVD